jgi:hypothetical protein
MIELPERKILQRRREWRRTLDYDNDISGRLRLLRHNRGHGYRRFFVERWDRVEGEYAPDGTPMWRLKYVHTNSTGRLSRRTPRYERRY